MIELAVVGVATIGALAAIAWRRRRQAARMHAWSVDRERRETLRRIAASEYQRGRRR
jgi:threonine dehydrogenase-like Zn-dependent dehydrogenase